MQNLQFKIQSPTSKIRNKTSMQNKTNTKSKSQTNIKIHKPKSKSKVQNAPKRPKTPKEIKTSTNSENDKNDQNSQRFSSYHTPPLCVPPQPWPQALLLQRQPPTVDHTATTRRSVTLPQLDL